MCTHLCPYGRRIWRRADDGWQYPGETRVLSIAIYEHVETLNYDAAHMLALGLLCFSFLSLWLVYRYAGHRFEVVRG